MGGSKLSPFIFIFPLFFPLAPVSGHLPTSRNSSHAGIGTAIHSILRLVDRQDKQPRTPQLQQQSNFSTCFERPITIKLPCCTSSCKQGRAWISDKAEPKQGFLTVVALDLEPAPPALRTPWCPNTPVPLALQPPPSLLAGAASKQEVCCYIV